MLYDGTTGTGVAPCDEIIHLLGGAFGFDINGTVGHVPDKTPDSDAAGRTSCGVAETDALDAAYDEYRFVECCHLDVICTMRVINGHLRYARHLTVICATRVINDGEAK